MSNKQESFVVSARKYRPESWKEVIGQGAITETLHNSITQDHMAHAYLFCGPRGVGKTTCARIFAKEINRSEDHAEGEDFSFNIFELDAASNNSVEDIRSLTEQVRIPPQVGKYRVYIIDEVHMLSKQAFNAFLKTLEEPPKHAIFILATTEKHKIIPTILSRCQIYDFNRIGVSDIVGQIKKIADNESIKYEEEALHVIAQKADGAMRDALSIFDQLSSFTNDNLTYDAVLKNLHVLDYDYYFTITEHLVKHEFADILVILDSILKQGFDGHHFIGGLGSHFRDLLVCKEPKTIDLLEVGDSVKSRYMEQSQAVPADWLIEGLKLVNEADFRYRNAPNTRILIETSLLSLASLGLEKKNDSPELIVLSEPKEKKKIKSSEDVSPAHQPAPAVAEPSKETPLVEQSIEQMVSPSEPSERSKPKSEAPNEITEKENAAEPSPPVEKKETALTPKRDELTEPGSRRKRKPSSTVSLRIDDDPVPVVENAPNEKSDEEASSESVTEPTQDFPSSSTETLSIEDAWKRINQELLAEGKNALYSILAKQKVGDQASKDTISVHLSHEVDEEEFNNHKADLLAKIRSYTGQKGLGLTSERIQGKEETKLFTPQDKFEYLAQQNPLLRKLKSDLDLDITY
ncbi:MAG: DNA polymerase III subunit gamma/tau [Flavobacteriales bacterium]|nr:DNA polymerase III subunit gamma/tau [Flavobacteriales bacterium]